MNLTQLTEKNGLPKILIDHWNKKSTGYACFEYEDTIKWDQNGIFLNNKLVAGHDLAFFQKILDEWKNQKETISAIGYINYNFKNLLYPHIKFKNKKNDLPYLYFVKPKMIKKYSIEKEKINTNVSLSIIQDIINKGHYKKIIHNIKNELSAGNAYQINYTMLKKYFIESNPFDVYLQLRNFSEPLFGYYLNFDDTHILSFSPEQFFVKENNIISSYPMKGTESRSNDFNKDLLLKNKLKESTKNKAEHLMIVDLIRNDLGKICKYGSVKVNKLYNVKSYETVHQMVTEVYGELNDNVCESDIIKALFPGGSITGAPKESAMKIIDKLENYNRNIYTGAVGYIENNGNMNFNMPIRTMTIINNEAYYPVGGGIVWDSNYSEEWIEAQLKSKILDNIVQGSFRG